MLFACNIWRWLKLNSSFDCEQLFPPPLPQSLIRNTSLWLGTLGTKPSLVGEHVITAANSNVQVISINMISLSDVSKCAYFHCVHVFNFLFPGFQPQAFSSSMEGAFSQPLFLCLVCLTSNNLPLDYMFFLYFPGFQPRAMPLVWSWPL